MADVVTNEQGGSQSRLDFDFTQLDADMLVRVARVLDTGAKKYGEKNWQKISTHDHINHMIYHAIMANTNDTSEDHLANTICRAMFAMWTKQNDLVTEIKRSTQEQLEAIAQGKVHWVLEPPFGYRKFDTFPGGVTAPMDKWCTNCTHGHRDHIITPNISGHVLICAMCECRQQLFEGEHWCETCKHPMSHHPVTDWHKDGTKQDLDGNVIDTGIEHQLLSCVLCGCQLDIDVDKTVDDPPTPPENICTCGHHVIAHHEITGHYKGEPITRGSCRKCLCAKFVPSTDPIEVQDKQ